MCEGGISGPIRRDFASENDESRVARIAPNHPGFLTYAEERT